MEKDKILRNFVKTTIREFINEQFDNNENMKNFLTKALDDAFIALEKQVPQTKKKTETISIQDVKPSQLMSFMKSNDIPNDAHFTGTDNGYDGWNDIVLAWDVDIPTTEKDRLEFKRRRFTDISFKKVYDLLTTNGYKRVGYNTGLLKQFDKKTVYDMYMDKDFDTIVKYYSLPFVKEG